MKTTKQNQKLQIENTPIVETIPAAQSGLI